MQRDFTIHVLSKCKEYIILSFDLPDIKCKVPIRYTSKMELNPIQLWSKKYSGISPGKNLSQWALISLVVLARANLPKRVPGKWTKFRAITQCLFPPTLRHICKKMKRPLMFSNRKSFENKLFGHTIEKYIKNVSSPIFYFILFWH